MARKIQDFSLWNSDAGIVEALMDAFVPLSTPPRRAHRPALVRVLSVKSLAKLPEMAK